MSLANRNHFTELSKVGHLILEGHPKSTFDFIETEQPRVEARNSMSNCKICFPLFFEIAHTTFRTISQYGLIRNLIPVLMHCMYQLVKKIGCVIC